MRFHDNLNEKIWDLETNDMLPEVKEKLKEIAEAFIEFLEIPTDAVLDKVITGSSASYNYNEFSDLDLHIIVDYDKVHEDCPLVNGYLNSLKKQFNDNHDIFIHGVPVELYAEQKDQGTVHNGLYSLQTGWIDKPQKIEPTDNDAAVEAKFNEIKELVDKCDDSEEATELLEKIYNMRKAGLAEAGEFCTENLAFKKLRNEGCMDKLRKIKKEQIDKQLSLESYSESLQDEYKQAFDLLMEGENIVGTLDTDFGKQFVKDVENLYKLKSYKLKLSIAKEMLKDIQGYLVDEQYDGYNAKIDKFMNNSKSESIKEELEEKEYQGCKYTILPDGKYCSIRIYAPKGYSFKNGDTWYGTEAELKKADKKAKDIIDNEIELKESIKESEDELTLEDKLINILTKDGWNHLNGRGGESLEKDNITIGLYVDSVIFNEFEDDEEELPLNTEEDLQNIIQIANKLSNKNESIKEDNIDDIVNSLINKYGKEKLQKGLQTPYQKDYIWGLLHREKGLDLTAILDCLKSKLNESIKEDYEEDDCENCPEEMHKERYAIYFETQEGNKKYTIYHVYTDSTDDSYNELCDKKDNQLGMYNSYQELKDALKERAEKVAAKQGWTVKSIENLGEDDEYYRERNKWESIHKLNRTINKAIGEDMEKEPVYHYSVEDIDKQGNDFDNAEEAYEQAQKDLTALGYEVKELNDDGEFEIVSTSTGVAHTGVIYPSNPELDESLQWEICRDMEKGHFYICNDEEIYCDQDGEPYHFNTREEAEEFLHTLNEDATTLEKKLDVAQDTLNDLLKSITDVREDFDLDKAYNLINEALKED